MELESPIHCQAIHNISLQTFKKVIPRIPNPDLPLNCIRIEGDSKYSLQLNFCHSNKGQTRLPGCYIRQESVICILVVQKSVTLLYRKVYTPLMWLVAGLVNCRQFLLDRVITDYSRCNGEPQKLSKSHLSLVTWRWTSWRCLTDIEVPWKCRTGCWK